MSHDRGTLFAVSRRVREWVLLDGHRNAFAAAILVVGLGFLGWLQAVGIFDVERDAVPMLYLFAALIGGNFTLVTIVISINQLVLSRELRTPRELRSERDAAAEYRDAVEDETEQPVIPEDPGDFLEVLIRSTREQVDALGDELGEAGEVSEVSEADEADEAGEVSEVGEVEGDGAWKEVVELRRTLAEGLDIVIDTPEEAHGGVFHALSTVLDADFASWINRSRWIRQAHSGALSESTLQTIESIEDRLEQLDVARQYFKTVYIQQELADLSKVVLYTGLSAVSLAVVFLVYVGHLESAPSRAGQIAMPIAVTINLAPMTVLFTHVLRIATVARRTAAITPFISPA